jgi:hypothetical protein
MNGAPAALFAAVLVACAASASCAPRSDLRGIGTSTGGTGGPTATELDGGVATARPGASPIPADFRTWARVNEGSRFVSLGHAGGRWEADVYADANGASALSRAAAGHAPAGSRFVEEHYERGDAGAGPIFMMEKRPPGFDPAHGDWRYVAVGAGGDVAGDGAIPGCVACHDEAPGDHLFRAAVGPE